MPSALDPQPAAAWRPRDGWPAIVVLTLYVGALLNLPVFVRRLQAMPAAADPGVQAMVGLSEALLVLAATGLLALLASLPGRWIWRLAGGALLVVSALCAYFMTRFDVVIGYGVVNAVLTTDHEMSTELLGWRLALWLIALALLPLVWLWRAPAPLSLWQALRRPLALAGRLLALAALVALLYGAEDWLGDWGRRLASDKSAAAPNPVGVAAHSYVPTNWIAGAGMVASNAWAARQQQRKLVDPAERHHYQPAADLSDVVLVVVIGESARSDRFGMLGHTRATTPRLAAMPNLVGFAAQSCDTVTKLSLACMFVRPEGIRPDPQMGPDEVLEDNVFSVLRKLGFGIELYAMQSEVGFYNRVKADFYKFREVIAAQPENAGRPIDDLLLLPEVEAALQRRPHGGTATGPRAIVLHTKGSHYLYSQRYPRSFARWTPECLSTDAACSRDDLLNAYDNSILYTDHVLAELIGLLRERKALLVYASDHGESIAENSHFHGTPRKIAPPEQRAVPMLFWASDAFLADPVRRERFDHLAARRQPGFTPTHGQIFASVLGCLGVDSPHGGITPADDLCR